MNTLYIDNSIFGRDQDWPSIAALLASKPEMRVVVSDWHMVELASVSDKLQAFKRADFVDSLKPLWMLGYLPIQELEVKRFTSERYFCVPAEAFSVFTEHLSVVWADYVGAKTVIGMNARTWVTINRDLSGFTSGKAEIVESLKTLQAATAQQKKEVEEATFMSWVLPRINDCDPDGKVLTKSEKMKIASFCYANRSEFYSRCPAIAVESELHKIRSRDAKRSPKGSDAIDLFHGVLALSYCDFYVTRDGFARSCAIYARKELSPLRTAEIYGSMGDISAVLGIAALRRHADGPDDG